MKSVLKIFIVASIFVLPFVSSCDKEVEDPIIPNEEELITTVIYTLVDTLTNDTIVFTYRDADGDGGLAPEITNADIQANTNYMAYLHLFNESATPAVEMTPEIINEAAAHQFFYINQSSLDLDINYEDSDVNGNPLGLETSVQSFDVTSGQLTIVLRHEPDKYAAGVASGDITNAGGGTDIEVTFEISVL